MRHPLQHFVCAVFVVFGLCAPDHLAAQAVTQDDTPFLSLSVSAAQPWGNADYGSGPHGYRYLELAAAGYSALLTDFTLPGGYVSGGRVEVRFLVNSVGDCVVVLGASAIQEEGDASAFALVRFPNGAVPGTSPRWTVHRSELRPFTLVISPTPSRSFEAGDSISLALERFGDDAADTCAGIFVSGISVIPEAPLFADGFEAGNTAAWNSSVP